MPETTTVKKILKGKDSIKTAGIGKKQINTCLIPVPVLVMIHPKKGGKG